MEKWNVRTLENKINSMLFERTALSKKTELVAQAELEALREEDQYPDKHLTYLRRPQFTVWPQLYKSGQK
jgi:predicted nuclease of restriction endonuclease-like (RecB) superfamily